MSSDFYDRQKRTCEHRLNYLLRRDPKTLAFAERSEIAERQRTLDHIRVMEEMEREKSEQEAT